MWKLSAHTMHCPLEIDIHHAIPIPLGLRDESQTIYSFDSCLRCHTSVCTVVLPSPPAIPAIFAQPSRRPNSVFKLLIQEMTFESSLTSTRVVEILVPFSSAAPTRREPCRISVLHPTMANMTRKHGCVACKAALTEAFCLL